MAGFVMNGALVPMNFETITVDGTAGGVALTAAEYDVGTVRNSVSQREHAQYALITIETAAIRWTVDGTAPVGATTGHYSGNGESIELHGPNAIKNFRAIRDAGVSATIQVTYFKN